ncbi:hypothetical protein HPB47_025433 [Ixodes persulcatus]|uniref:Uncharacterized protein n=1 Tax=Ixodes persulcatus TaxID=34615 RepID=A0AC60Q1G4_IXOPE|nr:hypothetical protein HPB47_025433 [Ixodes persulcatus]
MHSDSDEYVDGDNAEWAQPDERGRKHRRSSDKWKRNVSKMKRNQGEEYTNAAGRGTGGGAVPGEAGRIISIVDPDAMEGCGAPAVPGPPCPRAERHSDDTVADELVRGQQRLVELAVARLPALEQQTSAIRQLTLVLLLLVLMTSATRQPCLPLPCRPPTPPPLD